jgi:hypothetical protein
MNERLVAIMVDRLEPPSEYLLTPPGQDRASPVSQRYVRMFVRNVLSRRVVLGSSIVLSALVGWIGPSTAAVLRDPVIAAAGDIACGSTEVASSGNSDSVCQTVATSDLLLNRRFAKVLALGDEQYPCGSLPDFQSVYDPSWGRVKAITRPVAGNHEYESTGAGCDASGMASGYYDYFGRRAGSPRHGITASTSVPGT